ncbi:hypothetical protein D1AOALGA4SA_1237 [Olavius algarvensis Delta 1 endosymbiont]|nr:hypothetical protein D1AOALGA4SA_1237 [Olavius algarvensis Delta 1 endosymbiont]
MKPFTSRSRQIFLAAWKLASRAVRCLNGRAAVFGLILLAVGLLWGIDRAQSEQPDTSAAKSGQDPLVIDGDGNVTIAGELKVLKTLEVTKAVTASSFARNADKTLLGKKFDNLDVNLKEVQERLNTLDQKLVAVEKQTGEEFVRNYLKTKCRIHIGWGDDCVDNKNCDTKGPNIVRASVPISGGDCIARDGDPAVVRAGCYPKKKGQPPVWAWVNPSGKKFVYTGAMFVSLECK